jgi:hypothetical protein
MKRLINLIVLIVVFVGLLPQCYYDSKEYLYPELNTQCDTSNVTFSVSVKNVLSSNSCLICHSNATASAGGGIKLEDYTNVKAYTDNGQLLGSVMHQSGYSPMPKNGGSLNACDIAILKKWIAVQTPNN